MREELEISKLLSTDIPYIKNRTLVVWGMGNTSVYYYEGLKRLEKDGFVIEFYTDSNIMKDRFNGKPVIKPCDIIKLKNPLVLIATPQYRFFQEIKAECESMNVEARHIDEVILKLHQDIVCDNLRLFYDDSSREIYSNLIKCRMGGGRSPQLH